MKFLISVVSLVALSASVALATDKEAKINPDEQALLTLTAPSDVKVKQKGEISFAIAPEKGWKVSLEAPLSVKLKGAGKLIIGKRKLGVKDGSKDGKGFILKTSIEGASAGTDTVTASAVYFLCTDEVCKRFTATRELAVKVN
jgi:saccharopine dehydrogenase-like NADP-dependent oxidoreductase